jgi:hypothetical protein
MAQASRTCGEDSTDSEISLEVYPISLWVMERRPDIECVLAYDPTLTVL